MIERQFQLRCNDCRDPYSECGGSLFDESEISVAEIRKAAKAAGWRRVGDTDLCPDCLARLQPKKKPEKPAAVGEPTLF